MVSRVFGSTPKTTAKRKRAPKEEQPDPFGNFEVVVNGHRVTDPKELEKDKEMFQDAFRGFDFDFNPLSVAKDIHQMNSGFQRKYALRPEPNEQRLDPLGGLESLFSGLFGSLEKGLHVPEVFQEHFEQRKQKEKQLKDMHKSIMNKSYISGYQTRGTKDLGGARVESEDAPGEDLLEKIKDTLDSTERVERNVDIGGALEGIRNGMHDLKNLERLNREESRDVLGLLKSLQEKYQSVNGLAESLRKDFGRVKRLKKKLQTLDVGETRRKQERDIAELETRLKNNKGARH